MFGTASVGRSGSEEHTYRVAGIHPVAATARSTGTRSGTKQADLRSRGEAHLDQQFSSARPTR